MATVLEKTLKRELLIKGRPFMLSISPTGLLLTVKGRRKGLEIEWADLVDGEAALANALNASLHSSLEPNPPKASTPANASGESKGNGPAHRRRS